MRNRGGDKVMFLERVSGSCDACQQSCHEHMNMSTEREGAVK